MNKIRCLALLVLVGLAQMGTSAAVAIPVQIPFVGVLEMAPGEPVPDDEWLMGVSLHPAADPGGAAVWGPFTFAGVETVEGTFTLLLGGPGSSPIDDSVLMLDELWLEISIDGEVLDGRMRVFTVPYARLAGLAEDALQLAGLDADHYLTTGNLDVAGSVSVNGIPVISTTGQWVGPPVDTGSTNGVVPGTVITWWRPNSSVPIPSGYQVCDGSAITTGPLAGHATPDLLNRFAKFVPTSGIGTTGGAASVAAHVHAVDLPAYSGNSGSAALPAHVHSNPTVNAADVSIAPHAHDLYVSGGAHGHSLPSSTEGVLNGGASLCGQSYRVCDDSGGWSTGVHLRVDGGNATQEGQHRHALGGSTGTGGDHAHVGGTGYVGLYAGSHTHAQGNTGNPTSSPTTQVSIAHDHPSIYTATAGEQTNEPPYFGLLPLIRVLP